MDKLDLKARWNKKTPKFWKKVQKLGITVAGVGGLLLATPVALPAAAVTLGGYLVVTGGVIGALSQLTVE